MPHFFFCFFAGGDFFSSSSSPVATSADAISLFGLGESGVGGTVVVVLVAAADAEGDSSLTSSGFIKFSMASVIGAVGLSDMSRAIDAND
jgi:hypothetical protein